ncbi:MAG: alpha/beta hydrolase [Leptospiraceae bacterium]
MARKSRKSPDLAEGQQRDARPSRKEGRVHRKSQATVGPSSQERSRKSSAKNPDAVPGPSAARPSKKSSTYRSRSGAARPNGRSPKRSIATSERTKTSQTQHRLPSRPRRILWIPGLGADRRMYGKLIHFLDSQSGPWKHHLIDFPNQKELLSRIKSLQDLAEVTLAESIQPLQDHGYESRPHYDTVIGVSMGGMIAQILVGQNRLHTENLILISTAYRGQDVRQPFLALAWIPSLLPGFLRRIVQWTIGTAYPLFRRNVQEAREYAQMFLQFPRKIFFEAPRWIKGWSGEPGLQATMAMKPLPPDSHSVRVFRIHGTSDPLLSYKKISSRIPIDLTFPEGSHIIFATEARSIARKLKEFLDVGQKKHWDTPARESKATKGKRKTNAHKPEGKKPVARKPDGSEALRASKKTGKSGRKSRSRMEETAQKKSELNSDSNRTAKTSGRRRNRRKQKKDQGSPAAT